MKYTPPEKENYDVFAVNSVVGDIYESQNKSHFLRLWAPLGFSKANSLPFLCLSLNNASYEQICFLDFGTKMRRIGEANITVK